MVSVFLIGFPVIFTIIVGLLDKYLFKSGLKLDAHIGIGLLLSIFIIFPTISIMEQAYREQSHYYDQEMVALKDSETMIVSRHSTDSKLYYYYMVKNGNMMESRQAEQGSASITYLSEGEEPYVEVYKEMPKSSILEWIFPESYDSKYYSYVFHVPEGSVDESFNVNLK